MPDASRQGIKLFYCYAREDKDLRDQFEIHLSGLKRYYRLANWHDREILPGQDWEQALDEQLNSANVIFLLISPHFMASDYCYGKEMQRALERHAEGSCLVMPILLRPTHWEGTPFGPLQLLPTDARPVTRWPDRDDAFQDVVKEVSRAIKDLLVRLKTKKDWLDEGISLRSLKRYNEALLAFEQALALDPTYGEAYQEKGTTLYDLERYEEALEAYEQALVHQEFTNEQKRTKQLEQDLNEVRQKLATEQKRTQESQPQVSARSKQADIPASLSQPARQNQPPAPAQSRSVPDLSKRQADGFLFPRRMSVAESIEKINMGLFSHFLSFQSLQLNVTGIQSGQWYFTILGMSAGVLPNPSATITIADTSWLDIVEGKLDPDSLPPGVIKIEGDGAKKFLQKLYTAGLDKNKFSS